jgi:HlyD family secretion protein
MKRLLLGLLLAVLLLGGVAAGYKKFHTQRSGSGAGGSAWRTMPVRRGEIKLVVNSTGTVQPVLSVQVGAFVSGPVEKVLVDFNDRVKKDQVLAVIDPRTYQAAVAHAKASLAHSQADVIRVQALLEQARRNERRGLTLQKSDKGFISETDLDQCITDRKSLEAQLELGKAMVLESKADLDVAVTNLEFTTIKAPVDGMVIDRKVDPGQTVAAQFQTPVMFVVAPDLEKKIYVYASVDEADIGLIRQAQSHRQPVTFTVDAYPKDTFRGKIFQVRLNPSTVQNVVTYTVVVESPNPELKLLPGMTANLCFQVEQHAGVLIVPGAALRFYPRAEQVQPRDRSILEGAAGDGQANGESTPPGGGTTNDGAAAADNRGRRYVWVVEGERLAAVEVVIGLSDKSSAEVVSGSLSEGREVVIGAQEPAAK